MGLQGEEVHMVEEMLSNLHIKDIASAETATKYLNDHIREMKKEVSTLQTRTVDL